MAAEVIKKKDSANARTLYSELSSVRKQVPLSIICRSFMAGFCLLLSSRNNASNFLLETVKIPMSETSRDRLFKNINSCPVSSVLRGTI
jgi:hypothetical protein